MSKFFRNKSISKVFNVFYTFLRSCRKKNKTIDKISRSVNNLLRYYQRKTAGGDVTSPYKINIDDPFLEYFETPIGNYYLPNDAPNDVIINSMKFGKIFEPEIIDAAAQFIPKGSIVLDLGANFGQMSLIFSDLVGEEGQVYSFEAAEDICEILKKNITANNRNNITPICKAVFDTVGETKFYPKPDFSRFGAYGSYGIDPKATEGRTVATITIDSLSISGFISFMKVDIQGSDLFALKGARDTIMRNRMPIMFEYEEQFQEEFGTSFADYMNFIESIQYRIVEVISDINFLIVPKETNIDDIKNRKSIILN